MMDDNNKTVSIDLGNDLFALIDMQDVPLVIGKAIRAKHIGQSTYARISVCGEGQKEKRITLHRYLMGNPEGLTIDHINGNTLDNRRINLRACTQGQNCANSKQRNHSTQKYKGVHSTASNRYAARIGSGKRYLHLGVFDTPELAATAYNEAAIKLYGDFARLNDLPNTEQEASHGS